MSTLAGLSLRDLEYAVAVARLRHFGRAAVACGVSQPGLSEQIRKLEAMLGQKLFERAHREVRPTPRGVALLRQAERVLAEARDLVELARGEADPLSGVVRLGAIATLAPYYLPHLLRRVRDAFPRLALHLTEDRTAALVAGLRGGALDAILLALPDGAEGLATEALFFEPFRLVCPEKHELAGAPSVRLHDLPEEGLLLLEDGHCLRDQTLSLCGWRQKPGQERLATSVETLWHMVAAGEGYSLLPTLATLGRETMGGLAVCRRLEDAQAGRTIGLAWRASDPRGEAFRRLGAFLAENPPAGLVRAG